MKRLQAALKARRCGEAVALLRAARYFTYFTHCARFSLCSSVLLLLMLCSVSREVWPEGEAFGAADAETEDEFMSLR